MSPDYIYDDGDPGPAPGPIPVCPICPSDRRRDLHAVATPMGWWCGECGFWMPPHPPPANHPKIRHLAQLAAEGRRAGGDGGQKQA